MNQTEVLGADVRAKRVQLSVGVDTLAALAGISSAALSKFERNVLQLRDSTKHRLLAALGVLDALAAEVAPLKLDFQDVTWIREAIARIAKEKQERATAGAEQKSSN
jgi:transcriptional regulator with XRE-family HTH domain